MTIQRQINGFRFAEVLRGDTLQRLAAREMGDASRWPELVGLNGLVPPFLSDDPGLAGPGVLASGQFIRVPAASSVVSAAANPDAVFGRDVLLRDGQIDAENGDFALVAGNGNLRQALVHGIVTERSELMFHAGYGSLLRRVVGMIDGPTSALLAAQYAKAAALADPRVSRVSKAEATAVGDSIVVRLEVIPVAGKAIDITVTV